MATHSVTRLRGASGVMSAALCAQSSCQAWQLCQNLSLASVHAALCLFMRLELSCIAKPFARWICNSSDRSQGRAITQTLAESAASPASGKTYKTSWLLWAQQSSSFWVYTHRFVVLQYKSSHDRKLSWYFMWNYDTSYLHVSLWSFTEQIF